MRTRFLSNVIYDKKPHNIEFTVPDEMLALIYSSKLPKVNFKIENLLALRIAWSMRIFLLANKLWDEGECGMPIDMLYDQLHIPPSYRRHSLLNQKIINPSASEISTIPGYSGFRIREKHDVRGRATMLFFHNCQNGEADDENFVVNNELASLVKEEVAIELQQHYGESCITAFLVDHNCLGLEVSALQDQFWYFDVNRVRENLLYVFHMYCNDNVQKNYRSKDEYCLYCYEAVSQNWVEKLDTQGPPQSSCPLESLPERQ